MAYLLLNAHFGLCEKLKPVVAFVLQPCNCWSGLVAPEKVRKCAVTRRSCGGGGRKRRHAPFVFSASLCKAGASNSNPSQAQKVDVHGTSADLP